VNEPSKEPTLVSILQAYLEAVDAGKKPDREDLLRQHPNLADELREFFADNEKMERFAKSLHKAHVFEATIGMDRPEEAKKSPARVRYFGDYELLEEIARGGMGVVYKALQVTLNRVVALKMILAGQLAGEHDVKRFHAEAEAAAKLDHPGIVPIFEIGEHEGQHYFSMAYVEGTSLAKKVSEGPLPSREAAELTVKIAAAIQYAHQQGIIHRDLKPANVLLDRNGQPRVTDFGLAKQLRGDSGFTVSGQILGTPSYMPPEQAAAKMDQIGPAADVYSLGAILYCLLTGRPPFQAASPMDTLLSVLEQEPVPPRQLNAQIPLDLETIALKCLEKSPGRRYATAANLAEELHRYLAGKPILARPVGRPERFWRWCKRQPALASAAAAAALALLAAALISIAYASDRAQAARRLEAMNLALKDEGDRTRSALRETKRQLAIVALERAESHRRAGESGKGLLQLAEAVRFAVEAGSADIEHGARAWIGIWQDEVHKLRSVVAGAEDVEGDRMEISAFGPDGKTVLVGGLDSAELLDVTTRKRLCPRLSFQGVPTAVAISPNGRVLAVAVGAIADPAKPESMTSTVHLWEAASGKTLGVLIRHPSKADTDGFPGTIQAIAFSPDSKILLTGDLDRTLRRWDVATGKEVASALQHPEPISGVAFSVDARIIAAKGTRVVRLWDAKTGRQIGRDLQVPGSVFSMVFSPDSKTVLTGGADGIVRVWEIDSGRESARFEIGHGPVLAVAISPDGHRIVTSTPSGIVRLWEYRTHVPIGAPMHHPSDVQVLAFQPDRQAVLTAALDGTIRVWELSTGLHPQRTWKPGGSVASLAFRPDGRALLAGIDCKVARLWDATTGAPLGAPMRHNGVIGSLAFSPDGRFAITACYEMKQDGEEFVPKSEVYRWNASNGAALGRLIEVAGIVTSVSFLPDGRSVLVATSPSLSGSVSLRLFESVTGLPLSEPTSFGSERVDHVVLSPDGRRALTGTHLGMSAQLWDVATGQPIGPPIKHPDWVMALSFRPDGKVFATGCRDKAARLWDAATGQRIGQPMVNGYAVEALEFSPDGQTLLAGCQDDYFKAGEARLWNAASGQPLAPPLIHAHAVAAIAFRPDGKAVATGDAVLSLRGPGDGDISIWNLPAPMSGDAEEIRRQIQVWTGLKLEDSDRFEVLTPEAWQKQRQNVETRGTDISP
jgi:eukaryotic-like serine/threonine-protein kinase